MARWLKAPVLLVSDASAMARSAAALVRGFEEFDPDLDFAGVLFNHVGGPGHAALLRDAVGRHCRSKVAGALPHTVVCRGARKTTRRYPRRFADEFAAWTQPIWPLSPLNGGRG